MLLEEVRKFGLEVPTPSKEEQETFDKMKELIKDLKDMGLTDSDTGTLESARLAPESTMTDGMPESTADIKCLLDDPDPSEICDQIFGPGFA